LSWILIRFLPPESISTRISSAPASREFSINSLTTDAGRSTTSPAAILLQRFSMPVAQQLRLRQSCYRDFQIGS
jgi:hypothetical protein